MEAHLSDAVALVSKVEGMARQESPHGPEKLVEEVQGSTGEKKRACLRDVQVPENEVPESCIGP